MKTAEIHFDILSYWHAGSGSGQGADLDAVVVKNAAGLPYLPGKTIKGLCREALMTLEEIGQLSGKQTAWSNWFGNAKTRYDTDSGTLFFASATPAYIDESWARANCSATRVLFTELAATEIDDNGLATDKSLRKIEVVIPMTLAARIESNTDDEEWITALAKAVKLIRSLGSHRRRGLGRVKVTIRKDGQEVTP